MAWSYGVTRSPINHTAGTVPSRPLLPGDEVTFADGSCRIILATTPTLLNLTGPDRAVHDAGFNRGIMFRLPIEGDDSQSIGEEI